MLSPIVSATLTENTDGERRTDFVAALTKRGLVYVRMTAFWGEALDLGWFMRFDYWRLNFPRQTVTSSPEVT